MRDVYLCYDLISSGFIGILPDKPIIIPVEVWLDVYCTQIGVIQAGSTTRGGPIYSSGGRFPANTHMEGDLAATPPRSAPGREAGKVRPNLGFGRPPLAPLVLILFW